MSTCRHYTRADVDYGTWYSSWMKLLARNHTRDELTRMKGGARGDGKRATRSHLRAIERTTSMTGQSQARAQSGNVARAAGDKLIAIDGALEIHDLFPEHAKEGGADE